jgi:hypothetical protein
MAALESLRLADMSDREVLLIVHDLQDSEGWVDSLDMADRMGMKHDRRRSTVASRLAWLRRYGAMEREFLWDENSNPIVNRKGEHRMGQRWRLTAIGEVIALGKLKAAQEKAVSELDDSQFLLLTRALAGRVRGADDHTVQKLSEREWRHQFLKEA